MDNAIVFIPSKKIVTQPANYKTRYFDMHFPGGLLAFDPLASSNVRIKQEKLQQVYMINILKSI